MNTRFHPAANHRSAYALVMVMTMVTISIIVLAATMSRSQTTSRLNKRNNDYIKAVYAAEAATEKTMALLQADYMFDAQASVNENLQTYHAVVPSGGESSYWNMFQFSDAQGHASQTYVEQLSSANYVTLESQYAGLSGFAAEFRIISNARYTGSGEDAVAAVQQDIQLAEIPVFQFAIFYNDLLEFTWAAPLTVRGRVHANGNIYTGSSAPLSLKEMVTATGVIQKRSWAGYDISQMSGSISFDGGKSTNANTLTLPVGTNNSPDAVRDILYPPPAGEAMLSEMGQQRFYNKAQMLLLVSNSSVTVKIKQPYDTAPLTVPEEQASYFLDTGKSMYDQREGKTVSFTEIDVAKFKTWSLTNSQVASKLGAGQPPNVFYVEDERTQTTQVTTESYWYQWHHQWYYYEETVTNVVPVQLAAIRLVNGESLPTRNLYGVTHGLTLATPNPLYVKGHYNAPISGHRGTTNTTATEPAALLSDAITVLSGSWNDSESTGNFTYRDASDTTVNAAILSGIVKSDGSNGSSPFSGGAMNLTRLLEDWGNGSRTLTLNTSIVNLFQSVKATAPWQVPGTYYYAPTRNFNFDQNFKDPTKLPPGTPRVRALIRDDWATPPPNTVNYAGN